MITYYAEIGGVAYLAENATSAEEAKRRFTVLMLSRGWRGLLERWRRSGAAVRESGRSSRGKNQKKTGRGLQW